MKKVLLFMAAAVMSVSITFAQADDKAAKKAAKEAAKALKAEIKAANKILKEAQAILAMPEGGNLNEANILIQEAMSNKHTKDNPDTWNAAGQIQNRFYLKENEKMYLGQKYDTLFFYNSLSKMYDYFIKCDELEQKPDAKGRVIVKYRPANKEQLYVNRPNLLNGGIAYYNKGMYKEAHDLFSQYIYVADTPILEEYNITAETDTFMTDIAAYYSVLAGMQKEDYKLALTHIDLAKKASTPEMKANIVRYEATSYLNLGDTLKWIDLLKAGMEQYPEDQYYYSNLISYYSNNNQYDELMSIADDMLKKNPLPIFRFVKGYIYQNNEDYDNAIAEYKKAIEQDPTYAGAYQNLGICYTNLAQKESDASTNFKPRSKELKASQEKVKGYYREALPFFEKLRDLDDGTDPDKKAAWTTGLYTCYYMLNMGPEFEEMEKIINAQ